LSYRGRIAGINFFFHYNPQGSYQSGG